MKFKTSDNLIDLLVGQSLYSNPDVAMRELLQNAEDACYLQSLVAPDYEPQITVRYSPAQNWLEISDNGFGMDSEIFEESFATIGASKTNSPKLKELLAKAAAGSRPIGQFGIGVLSCFGVAAVVEVRTRADGSEPISVRIADRRKPFKPLSDHRDERGTVLRLELKPDGPMRAEQVPNSVARYVRHAKHIHLENVDSGERGVAPEQWLLSTWDGGSEVVSRFLDVGRLQLTDAWDNINSGFDAQLVLCNSGFLVSNSATNVLPPSTFGFRGELNVTAGALTILMNREGFQQDESWQEFSADLLAHYRNLVAARLDAWLSLDFDHLGLERRRAIQRAVFLILRTPLQEVLGQDNVERARAILPNVLLLADDVDFKSVIAKAKAHPPLYAYRTDEQRQVQRSFSDRGQNFSLTETVRSVDLRITLLKLNDFAVVRVERHEYHVHHGDRAQNYGVHDQELLAEYCSNNDIQLNFVQDAPVEHTQIGSSPDAEAITGLFGLSSDLKIQSIDSMTDAIIADFNGYILNPGNPEVREILEIMPDAVGNPVRRELLSIYFALSTYSVFRAREMVLKLITDPEFESKARRTTGRYFREFLEERVRSLLNTGGSNA